MCSDHDYLVAKNQVQDVLDFAMNNNSNAVYQVPVNFVFFRTDGTSVLSDDEINEFLGDINTDFSPMNIEFVQSGLINYVDNSQLINYSTGGGFQNFFLNNFCYVSTAFNVYVGGNTTGSFSFYPTDDASIHNSIINFGSKITFKLGDNVAHETGHYFGLFHLIGPFNPQNADIYHNPNDPTPIPGADYDDHPYLGDRPRELVIRSFDASKDFPEPNCDIGGDMVCDTPATAATNSAAYPNPNDPDCELPFLPACSSGWVFDVGTCEYTGNYIDYNNDPISPPPIGSLYDNFMKRGVSSCGSGFTQGQFDRMNFYLYGFENSRSSRLNASFSGNLLDYVELENTDIPVPNVNIKITHPGDERFANTISDINGRIQGNHYTQTAVAQRWKLGSEDDLSYSELEWENGVTTADIVKIRQHIPATVELNSYQILAADANNTGTVTAADLVTIRKLILQMTDTFEDYDSPWLFIPEDIVVSHNTEFEDDPFNMIINGVSYTNEAPYTSDNWVYNIANGQNGNNGFDAIKIGDVNQTASVDFSGSDNEDIEDDEPVFVEIKEVTPSDDGFDVSFDISSIEEKVAFQAGLDFDEALLTYKGLTSNNHLPNFNNGDNFGLNRVTDGKVNLAWDSHTTLSEEITGNTSDFELGFATGLSYEDFLEKLTVGAIERSPNSFNANGIIRLDATFKNVAYDENLNPSKVLLTISPSLRIAYRKDIAEKVSIYPNPTADKLFFKLPNKALGNYTLEVRNLSGNSVTDIRGNINEEDTFSINVEDLSSGVYFYKISTSGTLFTGKFIVN